MPQPTYLPFVKWHANCDVDGDLIDQVGGLNFGEQNNPGVNLTGGVIAGARTCPNSQTGVNNQGFSRSCGLNEPFDLTGQKIDKGTFMGWYWNDSATTDHVYAEQTGVTEQEKSWHIRCVNDIDGGAPVNYAVQLFFRDNTNADYDYQFAIPAAGIGNSYPSGEWVFLGMFWDISGQRIGGWFYSSAGLFFRELNNAHLFDVPFEYTTRGVTWISANNSGGSIGGAGMQGRCDQISMLHGLAFDQSDVDYFWNGGGARAFPDGFIAETGGAYNYYWGRV